MNPDDYARAIISEGQRRNVTPKGIQIALATALAESDLRMYANQNDPDSMNFPHDAVGRDHQSVGLFQQQPWWGSIECRMDAACSAGQFYNGVGGCKGLTDFDYNSDAESPGSYAQHVQVSAVPDAYDKRWNAAVALYDRLVTPIDPDAWPLPPSVFWGPFEGPDNSWSNLDGSEPQSSRDGLARWQAALGIPATGVFNPITKAAAIVCQQFHGWPVTGNVYPGEWDKVIKQGWTLPDGVPLPTSGLLRANIDFCKQGFNARIGTRYDWGGYFDPVNVRQGTDCSGLVDWALKAVVWGPTDMVWKRTLTTESWPPGSSPGAVGPLGTICIGGQPPNWPSDAVVKVAIWHGGGGENSHIVCEIDGVLMESGGNGNMVEPPTAATPLDARLWTDFWYLPGPIIENTLPGPLTASQGLASSAAPNYQQLIYEQLAGPIGSDGLGHGWPQLGELTIVEFLARYRPALDALLTRTTNATAESAPRTEPTAAAPPAKASAPRKSNPSAKKAAPPIATTAAERKVTTSAKKGAPRKAAPKKP
jgi:hypothetical protein